MNNLTCCFTGHRFIPQEDSDEIKYRLENIIIQLIEQGVKFFGAGGALGFDTLAAQTVLKLKGRFPHIRLILVLPCKDQTKSWKEEDKIIYNNIMAKADKAVYTSEYYYNGCMHTRNRHLVDNSQFCICYLTENKGGTAYTVDYAKKKGLKIFNVAYELSYYTSIR